MSPSPVPAAARPIRVGLYISLATAIERAHGQPNHPVSNQTKILNELRASDLEIDPVIEPGSQSDALLAEKLTALFPGKTPADVTDVAALRKFDVIVACRVCFPISEALPAIESAVRGGTGLMVRQCLGGDNDGYRLESVRTLRLFRDAEPDALVPSSAPSGEAVVLARHPLLGTLGEKVGQSVKIEQTYGAYGTLLETATPLLRLNGVAAIQYHQRGAVIERPGYAAYPLVVGTLGKGRVVSASFNDGIVPPALNQATRGRFSIWAVRWAAGRDKVD
jgi:hypothetical protein